MMNSANDENNSNKISKNPSNINTVLKNETIDNLPAFVNPSPHALAPQQKHSNTKTIKRVATSVADWIDTLLTTFLIVLLVMLFLFRQNVVEGISMQPTFFDQDRVIMYKGFYKPTRGDIVILYAPNVLDETTGKMGEVIVKRIIGVSGDVIDIDEETGTVYRNGAPLDEPYIQEAIAPNRLGNVTYPLTVPENCVFVLGDNRNHSLDSRISDNGSTFQYVGCLDEKYILGKVVFQIWPLDSIGVVS